MQKSMRYMFVILFQQILCNNYDRLINVGGIMEDLYFYSSKIRTFFLILLGIGFTALGIFVGRVALNEEDFFVSVVGAASGLGFGFATLVLFKSLFSHKPYLILTKEELIMNASSRNPIPIKWEDIESYRIRKLNFNKFIDINLHDDEKYFDLMTTNVRRLNKLNKSMDYALFSIVWGMVKRGEREQLTQELDRRVFGEEEVVNED